MSDKVQLSFTKITQRLKQMMFPEVDMVVGIATGGVVPASLVAYKLERPLRLLHINYRAKDNSPQHDAPQLLNSSDIPSLPQRLLLVDDVSVSGQTLELARRLLSEHHIVTMVLKGKADYVLYPEIDSCVQWPWH